MKKNLKLLALVLLSFYLAGFAVDRIIPARPVQAAGETHPGLSSSDPSEKETLPPTPPDGPVVMIVIGLVSILFGSLAIYPLAFSFSNVSPFHHDPRGSAEIDAEGSVGTTETSGTPRFCNFTNRPYKAAWSFTSPDRIVSPIGSCLISIPSNNSDQPKDR